MAIVTRDSIKKMLENENPAYVQAVVGRALVAIFQRQTSEEQSHNHVEVHNDIGFSGADAHGGSITAKYFLRHKKLLDWQVEKWTKPSGKSGYPRLCKYHRQLNEIAEENQLKKQGA